MTENDEAALLKEAIADFRDLHARQTGFNQYIILHVFEDKENTAYQVRLDTLECNCGDMHYNREHPEVCKHLAYAIQFAEKKMDVEAMAVNDLAGTLREARDALESIRRYGTALEADQTAEADTTDSERSTSENRATKDPEGALKDILRAEGVTVENLKVWVDDQYGSLQFETNGDLTDDQYSAFVDWCQDQDGVMWDSDNYRNYIKKDDIQEVLG